MADWEVLVTVWKEGEVQGTLRFGHSPVTIGASSDNDVVLSDPGVSSFHGRLTVSRRHLAYRDHSTNGSFLEGHRVVEAELEPEHRLGVPPFELRCLLVKIPGSRRTLLRPLSELRPAQQAPEGESRYGLRILRGPSELEGSWLELGVGPRCIGRSEQADLRFELPTLSRLHAVVQQEAEKLITVQDLSSSNGLFVNGKRVPVADLKEGDEIRLGQELVLRVEARGSERPESEREEPERVEAPEPENFQIRARDSWQPEDGVVVLEVVGELVGEGAARHLSNLLDRAVGMEAPRLLLDLGELEAIDRLGLGTLAKAIDALEHLDGELRLFAASEAIRHAIERSRLRVFFRHRVDEDETAAREALGG